MKNVQKIKIEVGELSVIEVEAAESIYLRKGQEESFSADLKCIDKKSRLYSLSPFIDEEGILRVKGRCDSAVESLEGIRKPIILDPQHLYTKLLMQYYHEKMGHQGQETVANEIRKKYWILNFRRALRKIWYSCQKCKNLRVQPMIPQMGQLPKERVTGNVNPFTFTGMDYFGPINITVGRRHEKRYGVLFTCLTTRAVHLEVANFLTTDSAIMAIRRFISRRGYPKQISSDNGTNLKGAEAELRKSIENFNGSQIKEELCLKGIKWNFIPPVTPHMGGCWERLVRSVKTSLYAILKEQAPKEEVLNTLLAEVEYMVNNRPLTHISVDLNDPEPITPNHFLIGKTRKVEENAIGEFSDDDLLLRKQWRRSQRISDHFWKRWIKEFLPTLTRRTKWVDNKPI